MGFIYEERESDSPYVASITQGYTQGAGSTIRPAEVHWHMVLTMYQGSTQVLVVGPLTQSGIVSYTEGVEILWIKFNLGTFMPRLSPRHYLNTETSLPEGAGRSFWLDGATWQFPNYENVDTFLHRLSRQEVLTRDEVIPEVLNGRACDISERTVRHRFLHTTGLTQKHIRQYQRAQQATALLQQGVSILDTVYEAGYFDQPHLTRSLKQFIGYTPGEIGRMAQPQ